MSEKFDEVPATRRFDFIPGTSPREIAPNIFFQPIRSWHSNTFAGEKLTRVDEDSSGCMRLMRDKFGEREVCSPPFTVTHRMYWNAETGAQRSVFLSYPNAMGACHHYFWEVYPYEDDVGRFDDEAEMEIEVIKILAAAEKDKGSKG